MHQYFFLQPFFRTHRPPGMTKREVALAFEAADASKDGVTGMARVAAAMAAIAAKLTARPVRAFDTAGSGRAGPYPSGSSEGFKSYYPGSGYLLLYQ